MRKLEMASGEESFDSVKTAAYDALGVFNHRGEGSLDIAKFASGSR